MIDSNIYAILKSCLSNLKDSNVGMNDWIDLRCMLLKLSQGHDICIKFDYNSLKYLSNGYYCNNVKGCNIGITDLRDFLVCC
jgi:hypothetical protein